MDPKAEIEARLAKLSPAECRVLKLRCQGLQYKAIAAELVVSESTIKTQMDSIYVKLGMDQLRRNVRMKFLIMAVCPVLAEVDCQNGAKGTGQPGPVMVVQQGIRTLVDEDDYPFTSQLLEPPKSIEPIKPKNPPIIIRGGGTTASNQPKPWKWLLTGLVLGFLGLAAIGFVLREPIGRWFSQPTSPPSVVEVVITTTPVPLLPSATPVVVVITATPPPVSATPKATMTPLPPTNTPTPSFTPTASVALPFQDNFDQGLRPEWKILQGQPVTVNGRLGAAQGDEATVEIGDSTWGNNYTIEFDFYDVRNIDITISDHLRYRMLYYSSSGAWQGLQDGRWVDVAESEGVPYDGHLQLFVSGNLYRVFLNGKPYISITYGEPMPGPVSFTLGKDAGFIDNLSIVSQ